MIPAVPDLMAVISEERAAAWWLKKYAGVDGPVIRSGRLNKSGTPLYDTNWSPASAFVCILLRDQGHTIEAIRLAVGKSWHAVSDLFARVDAATITEAAA